MDYLLYYKKDKQIKTTKKVNVIDHLYYLIATVPTKTQIIEYMKKKKIKTLYDSKEPKKIIHNLKVLISKIDLKIPLYDEYRRNMFIINRENVYNRVVRQHYRFPNKELLESLVEKRTKMKVGIGTSLSNENENEKNLGEFDKISKHYQKATSKIIKIGSVKNTLRMREYRKLNMMIEFMNSYDLNTLANTYIKVFYYYSNAVGKNITVCLRPSFLPHFRHIHPYYSRSEIINMALNMEIIKPSKKYFELDKVMNLCKQIRKNDIRADTLLDHQIHIIKNKKIGIVQYYSLQGSFFINQYLRSMTKYPYKNEFLEKVIKSMWELINEAPIFDKSYTLYRFIKDDPHLKHLKIGQKFIVKGFTSTTRDPFYKPEVYKFGFILIKIKIPKNIKGVALSIETMSHFPEEQEIILSPLSILRLDKKDEDAPYYHTDDLYQDQIKTRYEFTYMGKKQIAFEKRPNFMGKMESINFLTLEKKSVITMDERIQYFVANHVNEMYQFDTSIGNKEYTCLVEWYDSTEAYKDFFAARTDNGFLIYTIDNNHVLFTIELGDELGGAYMYVNYYFRYSTAYGENKIKLDEIDFIKFLSSIAYYFEIKYVVLYARYGSCDLRSKEAIKKDYYGGNYCIDFYDYFKNKSKKYSNISSVELKPKFSYYQLDRLTQTKPDVILRYDDRDDIYQIYHKTFKGFQKQNSLADFYVWMVENYCIFIDTLTKKMNRLYKISENNPFNIDYYILDAVAFLYNRNLIDNYPEFATREKEDVEKNLPKNSYRLPENRNIRASSSRAF